MKLYDATFAPNPRIVRMFMAEKGVDIPCEQVDLMEAANRKEPYVSSVNPAGQVPVLELDDGTHISEVTAICEYIEDKHPEPALIGTNAEEKAETRMWQRRLDFAVVIPMGSGFRFGDGADFFKGRIHLIPQSADDFKEVAQEGLTWLDGLMQGNEFICGDRFSFADISLFCMIEFFARMGQPVNQDNKWVVDWLARVKDRDSASA